MLSVRLTELFRLLQCTNSELARYAGCSSSNISRLKTGKREPLPGSQSVLRLAWGIYRYADYENLLPLLGELCGVEEKEADRMVPAIIAWLYGEQDLLLPQPVTPKSKRDQLARLQCFGQRLNQVMTLLDYTNGRLAGDLNVDPSLISRYRAGIYHPNRNAQIRACLAGLLLTRAEKLGRREALAALCAMEPEALGPELFIRWLYGAEETRPSEIAETLLHTIENFTPNPAPRLEPPPRSFPDRTNRYWGTEGLRQAVIRFLTEAAAEGGQMLLYSDEPLDWMTGDRDFFAQWSALMGACVRARARIKIIHNVDRESSEMVSAITGWFPLYSSGVISPYVSQRPRNARFHHTVFLRPGRSCVLGAFPARAGEGRWYDYLTDGPRLEAIEAGFETMLLDASPLLKTIPAREADVFWTRYRSHTGRAYAILRGLSIATMPEPLLEQMLDRRSVTGEPRERALRFHQASRKHFSEILQNGTLHELLCLPEREAVAAGSVPVNLEAEIRGLRLTYRWEEYAAHCAAVRELAAREKNYHLTLLPTPPFREMQVFTMKDAVGVILCREPYTAFIVLNNTLKQSVVDYCDALTVQHAADRNTVQKRLAAFCGPDVPT